MTNAPYNGNNLQVAHDKIATESVDPIYLDPRLSSNATYYVLFRAPSGEQQQVGR